MDEFDEETNKSHDAESDGCGNCDFLEFATVWFCAPFNQSDGVFGEQAAWLTEFDNLIHVCRLSAETAQKRRKK